MSTDYYVSPSSKLEIEQKAYAWREHVGIASDCLAPDMTVALELQLPKVFPEVGIVIRTNSRKTQRPLRNIPRR